MVEMGITLILYISLTEKNFFFFFFFWFLVFDCLVEDLKNQFKQKNYIFLKKLETLLLDSANSRPVTHPKEIIDMHEEKKLTCKS